MASLFLQRCSSFTIIIISGVRGFASTTTTSSSTTTTVALKVLSRRIQDLSKKYDQLFQMRRDLRGRGVQISNLNLVQRLLLDSQPRVVYQLGCLEKLYEEIVPAGQLEFLNRDAPPTPPSYCPLSIINRQLTDLHRKLADISQIEGSLHSYPILDKESEYLLRTKATVVYDMNVLTEVKEEIVWEMELDPYRNAEPSSGYSEDRLRNRVMLNSRVLPEIITSDHFIANSTPIQPNESVIQDNTVRNLGVETNDMVDSDPIDKNRYLLVSNGWEIHCLDLNLSIPSLTNGEDVPLLPIIATVDLREENLPSTLALFKSGSNAYMIGRWKRPKALRGEDHRNSCMKNWGENPQGVRLHIGNRALYSTNRSEPAYVVLRLSLDDSKIRVLSHSEPNMGKLENPRNWPVVEEINEKLIVIDSCVPFHLPEFRVPSYLVVGKKIYAEEESGDVSSVLVFDIEQKKWEAISRSRRIRHVWDLEWISHDVWCVGEFAYGDVRDPLYVLIEPDDCMEDENTEGTRFIAYLVNSSGLILCIQPLVGFFKGVKKMIRSTTVEVEEEEDECGKKKTMCSVCTGHPWVGSLIDALVFIDIFTVKEFPHAADRVRQVVAEGKSSVELEFVRVDIMERHVYRTDVDFGTIAPPMDWIKLQACFM